MHNLLIGSILRLLLKRTTLRNSNILLIIPVALIVKNIHIYNQYDNKTKKRRKIIISFLNSYKSKHPIRKFI